MRARGKDGKLTMARFTVRPFSVIFQPPLEKLKALAGTAIDGQPSHFLEHREQAPRRVGLACTLRAGFASTAPWLPGGELAPRTSAALDGQGAGRESWAAGGSGFKLGRDCRVRQCDLRAGAVVSVWVAWPSARKRQRPPSPSCAAGPSRRPFSRCRASRHAHFRIIGTDRAGDPCGIDALRLRPRQQVLRPVRLIRAPAIEDRTVDGLVDARSRGLRSFVRRQADGAVERLRDEAVETPGDRNP